MARTVASRGHVVWRCLLAAVALRLLAPAFVSPSRGPAGLRRTVVGAEENKAGPAGPTAGSGFMSFLQVEEDEEPADIELSPEEYKLALDQEMLSQRKKYYIGGVVKKKNLIVPWKDVDEAEVEKEARRSLKKNGILDPSGEDAAEDDEETDVTLELSGADVRITWIGGDPGQKVGYIVERKKSGDTSWTEIGTYENGQSPQLLVKAYPGHKYQYTDSMVNPAQYSYRILSKLRGGDIGVVEQKDILVTEPEGIDDRKSIILLVGIIALYLIYGSLTQTKISWE